MLDVRDVCMQFGGIRAVDHVSLHIPAGQITGLIGPNGAGKSTLFNVIAGYHRPTSGEVWLDGEPITGLPPHELFSKGLLRTFQVAHEFGSLTVRENLMMVPSGQIGERLLGAWLGRSQAKRQEQQVWEKAEEVIAFLELEGVADEFAANLSGGQKKLLELGRTMMTDAKVVFLDEVGAGVNRSLLGRLGQAIARLNQERGYTFCMIEHDMEFIQRLCQTVVVMAEGRVLARDMPEAIMANEAVIEAYLGRAYVDGKPVA
jgi:branched-chain amino acid transport system ATP-binding protein